MHVLLPALGTTALVLVSAFVALFVAVVVWTLGNMIVDEIKLDRENREPRKTRAQKFQEEVEWEKYLAELRQDHQERPLNVFRDGVSLV